jgi:phospholipid transport system substrate-binding protein
MKDGKSLGFKGRYAELKPVVEQTLDLKAMTAAAVGPTWSTLTPAQQAALVAAFTHLTVASYAHNFDAWSGQKFTLEPGVLTRPGVGGKPDKIVQTKLIIKDADPVALAYRLRQEPDGGWKVIDIYYNGSISELSTRRSDFNGTLSTGGPKALIEKLNEQADKLGH